MEDLSSQQVLLLDAAAQPSLVASYRKGQVRSCCVTHPAALIEQPLVQEGPFDALLLGEGPGSYTGLRIAAATAGGLALGWNCPILLVSSLAAYVQPAETCVACLDARAGGIYLQPFQQGRACCAALRLTREQLLPFIQQGKEPSLDLPWQRLQGWPWVGPDGESLRALYGLSIDWRTRLPSAAGFWQAHAMGQSRCHLPPFRQMKLNYLKEDEQVVRRPQPLGSCPL